MTTQVTDLGFSKTDLESYLVSSGFWGDPSRAERHRYVLSPSAYVLSSRQLDCMQRLAVATYAAVTDLNERLCSYATSGKHLTHQEARLLKCANVASRSLLRPDACVRYIPPVLKVDLVQDHTGAFQIAEVDCYNPRGFGYAALLEESIPQEYRDSSFGGINRMALRIRAFSNYMRRWYLLVSEFERYYETSASIFVSALQARGIDIHLVRESEIAANPDHPVFTDPYAGILVIPDSMDQNPTVRDRLVARYQEGRLVTFYPPLAYLGSKAFLPELRLTPGMEEFIPATTLVGKKHSGWKDRVDLRKPCVLKATVSSGLKKVLFSDLDPCAFTQKLMEASTSPGSAWILQEQVEQVPIPIPVFAGDGALVTREYFLRVTAYISKDGIVDAEVTGRTDRKVHGAPDCIQIPVLR